MSVVNSHFSTVGPVLTSALNRPGGANSLGPVAPSPKWRCVSTIGPEAPQRFTKTNPLHAFLEQRHATPLFTNRKLIRNKSLELAWSQNEHDKTTVCLHIFINILIQKHRCSRFKVQGFFICHIINYTGYNQKWNVGQIRSAQWTVQRIKNYIKVTPHKSIYIGKKKK